VTPKSDPHEDQVTASLRSGDRKAVTAGSYCCTIVHMRLPDRPTAVDIGLPPGSKRARDLADRLLRLPPGHPSGLPEPDGQYDASDLGAAEIPAEAGQYCHHEAEHDDGYGTEPDEEHEPDGDGSRGLGNRGVPGWLSRVGTGPIDVAGQPKDPYRPWFAPGSTTEPWFAAGPEAAEAEPSWPVGVDY
jgi:hypothetical protein